MTRTANLKMRLGTIVGAIHHLSRLLSSLFHPLFFSINATRPSEMRVSRRWTAARSTGGCLSTRIDAFLRLLPLVASHRPLESAAARSVYPRVERWWSLFDPSSRVAARHSGSFMNAPIRRITRTTTSPTDDSDVAFQDETRAVVAEEKDRTTGDAEDMSDRLEDQRNVIVGADLPSASSFSPPTFIARDAATGQPLLVSRSWHRMLVEVTDALHRAYVAPSPSSAAPVKRGDVGNSVPGSVDTQSGKNAPAFSPTVTNAADFFTMDGAWRHPGGSRVPIQGALKVAVPEGTNGGCKLLFHASQSVPCSLVDAQSKKAAASGDDSFSTTATKPHRRGDHRRHPQHRAPSPSSSTTPNQYYASPWHRHRGLLNRQHDGCCFTSDQELCLTLAAERRGYYSRRWMLLRDCNPYPLQRLYKRFQLPSSSKAAVDVAQKAPTADQKGSSKNALAALMPFIRAADVSPTDIAATPAFQQSLLRVLADSCDAVFVPRMTSAGAWEQFVWHSRGGITTVRRQRKNEAPTTTDVVINEDALRRLLASTANSSTGR